MTTDLPLLRTPSERYNQAMTRDLKEVPAEAHELSDTKRVLVAACRLPKTARAEIASALLRTLDEDEDDPTEVEDAWEQEILRRQADLRAGRLETFPASTVLDDLDAIVNDK